MLILLWRGQKYQIGGSAEGFAETSAITSTRLAQGSVASGEASVEGVAVTRTDLRGSTFGQASASATKGLLVGLLGRSDGVASGGLKSATVLTFSGSASGAAAATVKLGNRPALLGESAGESSSADASVRLRQGLRGSSSGEGIPDFWLLHLTGFNMTAYGMASTYAEMAKTITSGGSSAGASMTSGSVAQTLTFAGVSEGEGEITAIVGRVHHLAPGPTAGEASATVPWLHRFRSLAAEAHGVGETDMSRLLRLRRMGGSATGTTEGGSTLTRIFRQYTSSFGEASLSGVVRAILVFFGNADGKASTPSALGRTMPLDRFGPSFGSGSTELDKLLTPRPVRISIQAGKATDVEVLSLEVV